MSTEEELERLADDMHAAIRRGLGPRSRWALRAALEAMQVNGVDGQIHIQIPSNVKDYVDVRFATGSAQPNNQVALGA